MQKFELRDLYIGGRWRERAIINTESQFINRNANGGHYRATEQMEIVSTQLTSAHCARAGRRRNARKLARGSGKLEENRAIRDYFEIYRPARLKLSPAPKHALSKVVMKCVT